MAIIISAERRLLDLSLPHGSPKRRSCAIRFYCVTETLRNPVAFHDPMYKECLKFYSGISDYENHLKYKKTLVNISDKSSFRNTFSKRIFKVRQ